MAFTGFAGFIEFTAPPRYRTSSASFEVDVTPERVARGKSIAAMRCFACHVDPQTGSATGNRVAVPSSLASVAYAPNITRDLKAGIGSWSDGELSYALRTGVRPDGRLLAPWMPRMALIADEDLYAVIAFLRSDDPVVAPNPAQSKPTQYGFVGKVLQRLVWRPGLDPDKPIVAPSPKKKVAYGKYVVQGLIDCYACHSASFEGVNNVRPELSDGYMGGGNKMRDLAGGLVLSANLTPDPETGIGKWAEHDFIRAVREGVRPDGTPLRFPMPHFNGLDEAQVSAIYAYLETVHPIYRKIPGQTKAGTE